MRRFLPLVLAAAALAGCSSSPAPAKPLAAAAPARPHPCRGVDRDVPLPSGPGWAAHYGKDENGCDRFDGWQNATLGLVFYGR